MRNFNERMDEIRKRAEALRKKRRQRRGAAACCVAGAACLCLALWNPVVVGPTKQALPEGIAAAGSGETVYYSATECAVTEIRVSGQGEEAVIKDTEKILHFLLIADPDALTGKIKDNSTSQETVPVDNCDTVGGPRGGDSTSPACGGNADDGEKAHAEDTSENHGAPSSETDRENKTSGILADNQELTYMVRLIFASGEEKQFLLTDASLINPETGAAVSLDRNQRQLLMELLGIG